MDKKEALEAQNFLTHDWHFNEETLECSRCSVSSYDETYAYQRCGHNFPEEL